MKPLIVVFLTLFVSCAVEAQYPTTGNPAYGSFQTVDVGTVNLQNLNLYFGIPLGGGSARGMNFGFGISYNSSIWVSGGAGATWIPVVDPAGNPTWGWNLGSPIGNIPFQYTSSTCTYIVGHTPQTGPVKLYQFYEYVEPDGTRHSFSVEYISRYQLCTGGGNSGTWSGYATDGSGFYIDISTPSAPIVYSPNGTKITPSSLTDSNGNVVSATYVNSNETQWTDSAGHVALTVITSTSSVQYQFPDPTGGTQTVTVNLSSQNIETAFGCSGVGEYSGTANLPTSITFSNGQAYSFIYEGSGTNTISGRLKLLNLPGGGKYTISYAGASNGGINCTDSTGTALTIVGQGTNTWTFLRSQPSPPAWQTAVTTLDAYLSPYQDETLFAFNSSGQETSRLVYQGIVGNGTLEREIDTVWASNGTPLSKNVVLEDGNTSVETETTYDAYGNLTKLVEHDWGTKTAPGPAIRTTNLAYTYSGANGSTYLAKNILNKTISKTIADQSGMIRYSEVVGYDSAGSLNAPCITNAVQHNDSAFGCSYTTRGLVTSDTVYANAAANSSPETKNFTYDSLGNLRTSQPDCCQSKTWSYSAATNYAYPDSIVTGSGNTSLTTIYTYNPYSGQVTTAKDENGHLTSISYDAYGRPLTATRPDNTVITYSYDDANRTSSILTPISGTAQRVQKVAFDTLGRPTMQSVLDASGTTYTTLETAYDVSGRAAQFSTPHNGGTQYWTKKRYDVLGRTTSITLPDGTQTTYTYSLNSVTVTDPAGSKRKSVEDGVGRLTTLFEPDPTNNNSLTQQTSYTYTVLDSLASVTQGIQTRSFAYDGIGRLTSASTPEAGSVSYQYSSFDLVTQRTDARGVVANYYYDPINRLTGVSYTLPQGSAVTAMPNVCTTSTGQPANVCYTYDQGGATANALGRLTQMVDPTGTETPSYDLLGRKTQIKKVINGTAYVTSLGYNLDSQLIAVTYPSGRVVQQSFDGIGRLCELAPSTTGCGTASSPYATAFSYNSASEVTSFNYGNGVVAAFTFSPDRLQLTSLSYSKGTQTLFGQTYWYKQDSTNCPNGRAANNGQIQCVLDAVDSGRTVVYGYDATERLSTAVTSGSAAYPKWGLSWTYDRYGNRISQTPTAGSPPSNALTFANPGGAQTNHADNYGYDASGNMLKDGVNTTIAFDAENRQTSLSGSLGSGSYEYDGTGLRVQKVAGTTTTVYIYLGAKVIAEYVNGAAVTSPTQEYLYAGDNLLAKVVSGATSYFHQDQLSNRLMTNSSGTVVAQLGTYPFGEAWYNSNDIKHLFTTYEHDYESGNDYALARSYVNRFGRFGSPDPFSGSTSDPQSLNHYVYAGNDPINEVDPSGAVSLPGMFGLVFLSGGVDAFSSWSQLELFENPIPIYGDYWSGPTEGDQMYFVTATGEHVPINSEETGGSWNTGIIGYVDGFSGAGGGSGGPSGAQARINQARNAARQIVSNKDCADFLKSVLSNLHAQPNLDAFLADFDRLNIIPTPKGDAQQDKEGYPSWKTTAHVAGGVGVGYTVHVDAPFADDLVPTLLHETFHDLTYGVDDPHLAAATGNPVPSNTPDKKQQRVGSVNASAEFDKHCTPKK